jgi:hypothetical protein
MEPREKKIMYDEIWKNVYQPFYQSLYGIVKYGTKRDEIWNMKCITINLSISQQTKIEGINMEPREMKCMYEIWNMKYEIWNV